MLLGAVLIHILAVVVTELRAGGNLVSAMFSGKKVSASRRRISNTSTETVTASLARGERFAHANRDDDNTQCEGSESSRRAARAK